MKRKYSLTSIKKFNNLAIAIDFIVPVVYTIFFGILFAAIKTPVSNVAFTDPGGLMDAAYMVLGRIYSAEQVNFLIGIFAVFMLFGYAIFVVNIKHNVKLEVYDYHRWEAGNTLVKGLTNILTLNFVSLALRIWIANMILGYSEDETLFSIIKKMKIEKEERKARDAQLDRKSVV